MYFYSTEVRWFFQGKLDAQHPLPRWFSQRLTGHGSEPDRLLVFEGEQPATPTSPAAPSRVDSYLQLAGAGTVGVKLRGGSSETSLEVKAESAAPASWRPPGAASIRVAGRTDSWTKWSFKHRELNGALEPMRHSDRWIDIGKERWLRKISAGGKEPTFVAADQKAYRPDHPDIAMRKPPDRGCNAELTQIFAGGDRGTAWYTFCLEAFGPEPQQTPRILNDCANLFFRALGPPEGAELTERDSFSYPRWLAML